MRCYLFFLKMESFEINMELNAKQKEAVFDSPGNSLVTAPPGSGKTRTLVARAINNLENLPDYHSIALITYTNAGADEIAHRLVSQKNAFIGTIHSFCLEFILRPFSWLYNWSKPCVISYEQQENFFEENDDIDLGDNKFDELGKIKKTIDGSLDISVDWDHSVNIEIVATQYYAYQKKLKVIDFNEILYKSYVIIKKNNFISKSLASKFYEILVDEFQDTNLYQYEIFKLIQQHQKCSFFMVGDPRQKIFSFAGAIDHSFEKAQVDFNAQRIELTETYRSSNSIVDTYAKLFDNHSVIENKSEFRNTPPKVAFVETTKNNHTSFVYNVIHELLHTYDVKLSEIAILSNSWYSAFPLSKKLRIDYKIVGLGALPHKGIYNSTFSLLRCLSKYYFSSQIKTLRAIKRNIDNHLLENNQTFSDKELKQKTNRLIGKFLEIDLEKTFVEGIVAIQNIFDEIFCINHVAFEEILKLVKDDEKHLWSIEQYLKTLAGVDGITCNTIHKAKGLEFDAVILNEINEKKIPYQKCLCRNPWTYEELTHDKIEDGRKVLYVALSRARKYLIVLHNWKPSMFIEKIK